MAPIKLAKAPRGTAAITSRLWIPARHEYNGFNGIAIRAVFYLSTELVMILRVNGTETVGDFRSSFLSGHLDPTEETSDSVIEKRSVIGTAD